jgi:hypothetical protein
MEVHSDFKDLFVLFNAHGVEYLVVGGYALAFHGAPRYTRDMDILIRATRDNAARMLAAIAEFGFPFELAPEEFDKPDQILQIGYPPYRVDVITSIDGVSWEEAWNGRQAGECGGVPVHFLGRDQFIANKLASGRLKDLADVEAIGEQLKPGLQRKGPRK